MAQIKNKAKHYNLFSNNWLYISVFLVFCIGFIVAFTVIPFNVQASLGQYGDVIGGVLGTLFTMASVLLMIKTFQHQQKATQANINQLETQRYNDLFFELLRLHHDNIQTLNATPHENPYLPYFKDFANNVRSKFESDDFATEPDIHQRIINAYMYTYVQHTEISTYFITLYRIYDLLDKANLAEIDKTNYLKVIRAQLTPEELLLLRYHSMCHYGLSWVPFINKYNILKHLPIHYLLEFDRFTSKFASQTLSNGISVIFNKVEQCILSNTNTSPQTRMNSQQKCKYTLSAPSNDYSINLTLLIDSSIVNTNAEYAGLEKLTTAEIGDLLNQMIMELLFDRNYSQFNNSDYFSHTTEMTMNGQITAIRAVYTLKNSDRHIVF